MWLTAVWEKGTYALFLCSVHLPEFSVNELILRTHEESICGCLGVWEIEKEGRGKEMTTGGTMTTKREMTARNTRIGLKYGNYKSF